jgi:hypothetical protein
MSTEITLDLNIWANLAYLHYHANDLTPGGVPVIWLCSDGTDLTAVAEGEGFHAAVRLDTPATESQFLLPVSSELLAFVYSLAPQDCALTVRFDTSNNAHLKWAQALVTFGAPWVHRLPSSTWVTNVEPQCETTARNLRLAGQIVGYTPLTIPSGQATNIPTKIAFTPEQELVFTRDWKSPGHQPHTSRVPSVARCEITAPLEATTDHLELLVYAVTALSNPEEMVRVDLGSVGLGRTGPPLIRVGTDHWSVEIEGITSVATSVIDDLYSLLTHQGRSCERIAADSLVVGSYPELIRVDATGPITANLRHSLVLASDITPSLELYEEINQINIGLDDISIWLHDGRIILGIDSTETTPHLAISAIDTLRARAEQLSPGLLAFAHTANI